MSRIVFFVLIATFSPVSVTIVLAQVAEKTVAEDANQTSPPTEERSLDIVVAEHVILWDGKIVSWDELIEGLREVRKRAGKPIHPNFYFTNGANKAGHEEKRQKDLVQVYGELFQPAGMTIGGVSPRASPRYDAIKKAADLIPPPGHVRKGIVRVADGQPVRVGTVVLVPNEAVMSVMLNPDLTLRDRLDEVWTRLDSAGRFEIAAPDSGHRLVVLSPEGFGVADVPAQGQLAEITLTPNVTLLVSSKGQNPQELWLTIHPAELPQTFPGFSIGQVKIGEKGAVLRLPPGRITVSRTFDLGMGTSRVVPAERLDLKAGERKGLSLSPADPDKARE